MGFTNAFLAAVNVTLREDIEHLRKERDSLTTAAPGQTTTGGTTVTETPTTTITEATTPTKDPNAPPEVPLKDDHSRSRRFARAA